MPRSFFERFPEYSISFDEGVERFLNRVNELIFMKLYDKHSYDNLFKNLCTLLGYDSSNYINHHNFGVGNNFRKIESITNRELGKTLHLLEYIGTEYEDSIKLILQISKDKDKVDLGIRYHNGIFYKAGDEDLDEDIINSSLDNISKYHGTKTHWVDAIKSYSEGNSPEALTNCYTTIEKLAKAVLNNNKTLGNNQNDLIKFIKESEDSSFNKQWREILKNLCTYLHDFSTRHGSEIENIDEIEVDGTIYLTGTVINLVSKKGLLDLNN